MPVPRLLLPTAALLALAAGGMLLLGLRGRDTAVSGTDASAPAVLPAEGAMAPGRLLLSEFHGAYSYLLSVSAADPANRQRLVRIEHAPNWAPRAAVAPGGDLIAYTSLPPGARSPDTDGTLWVIRVRAREPRRLAAGLDARTTPVWAPDGTRVVYQRALVGGPSGLTVALDEVDVCNGKTRELARAESSERLFPVGYAPDAGRFYYVRFSPDGAELHEVDGRTRAARMVARLGAGAARDFRLAPDGTAMLYLGLVGDPPHYRALAADLRTGDVRAVLPGVSRIEDVGVAWRPGATPAATVGSVAASGEVTGSVIEEDRAPVPGAQRTAGFDVPVAWAPDGRRLVVRAFNGPSADNPGPEQPVLLDTDGQRWQLTGDGPLEFVGWVTNAP